MTTLRPNTGYLTSPPNQHATDDSVNILKFEHSLKGNRNTECLVLCRFKGIHAIVETL